MSSFGFIMHKIKKLEITIKITFVLLSFLTFTLINAAPDPVLDITGKQVRPNTHYFILPVVSNGGGGLTLAKTGKKTCPLDVAQEKHKFNNGLLLTFHPVNPKKGVVRESTDLNIQIEAAPYCVQSSVWKLDDFDPHLRQWFVTTGGVQGNPGPKTVINWFKIERYEDDYKLVFCPTVCPYCKVPCEDVGIFMDGGIRCLALSDAPFKVMFKKQT